MSPFPNVSCQVPVYKNTYIYIFFFGIEWNCIYKRENSFLTFTRLNVSGWLSDLQGTALFGYRDGTCQCIDRKCLAVVMPMHKADSEGTPNTAVHLIQHVRGCRCHPGSVSFTWTSHSNSHVEAIIWQGLQLDFVSL